MRLHDWCGQKAGKREARLALKPTPPWQRAHAYLLPIRRVSQLTGIDKPVFYTIAGRGWLVLTGVLTLALVTSQLTPEQQGYYFTFYSVLALQTFFELGLSNVLLQFASHERAALEWTERGTLEGDPVAKARLSSLLRLSLLWYGVLAALVLLIILPAGALFFARIHSTLNSSWRLPWIAVAVVSATKLFINPIYAIIEGCGLVADIMLLRLCQTVIGSLLLWATLLLHWGLYAASIPSSASLVVGIFWLIWQKGGFLADLLLFRHSDSSFHWWRDIWPFQWKMAISTFSGYFVFELFNPVLFAYYGPVAAGQMGLSLTMINSLTSVTLGWLSTKAASFGRLIAQRRFNELDLAFFPAAIQSFVLTTTSELILWLVVIFLNQTNNALALRVLDPLSFGLLVLATILFQVTFAQAVYLHAHMKEPFLAISLLIGFLTGFSTYFLGRSFGSTGIAAGYLVVRIVVGSGLGTSIFSRKRREWHSMGVSPS